MGLNLSLNMASRGFRVCVCNRTTSKIDVALDKAREQGVKNYVGARSTGEFVRFSASLSRSTRWWADETWWNLSMCWLKTGSPLSQRYPTHEGIGNRHPVGAVGVCGVRL